MKQLLFAAFLALLSTTVFAQVKISAISETGEGYSPITGGGLDIETPDCVHGNFGAHVTQAPSELLRRNVFLFHSHIDDDNDRCLVFDRVRMEIKGGPGTDPESQHVEGETSYYRWKFRLPSDFVGASSFTHLFQNKNRGPDGGFPVITFTARASTFQIIHNGGDTGDDLGVVAQVDLDKFRGRWVEVYMRQVHRDNGQFETNIRDLATGETILSYENNNIDLWRAEGEYNRPKWGVYRRKSDVLKDEMVEFADFCISETSADLCPAEPNLIVDNEPPSVPANLRATEVMITSARLDWDAATDNVGVANYRVLQDGTEVWVGPDQTTTVTGLTGNTTYNFTVVATDDAGNASEASEPVRVTTVDPLAEPGAAGIVAPGDGATNQATTITLRWSAADNADTYNLYFGTDEDPALTASGLTSLAYAPTLAFNTRYYWRIGAVNNNGETLSSVWTFTTGADNPDLPWSVYRGNARPEVETNFWELNNAPDNPLVDGVVPDPDVPGNNFYAFRDESEENFRWRYRFVESDTAITTVVRFKAIAPDVNGVCFFETRGFGYREKIRIDQNTIKLERSSPLVEMPLPFDPDGAMHVIRITMKGPLTTVYFDEDPEPYLTGVSGDTNASEFFEWGKSGRSEYGATIDWVSIVINQAWAPGEGAPLAPDLVLSSETTLDSLAINGVMVPDFDPDQTEYTVEAPGGVVPSVTFRPTSRLATTDLVLPATAPNTAASITVTAQDGINDRIYVLRFVPPVSTLNELSTDELKVFPNPATDELAVRLTADLPRRGAISVRDPLGRLLLQQDLAQSPTIDLRKLPTGLLLVEVVLADGRGAVRKVMHLE